MRATTKSINSPARRLHRLCFWMFLLGCMGTVRIIKVISSRSFLSPFLVYSRTSQGEINVNSNVYTMDLNLNNVTNKTNPYFILHVGPPKTATTLLQYTLTQYQQKGILAQDGYAYLGQFVDDTSENMVQKHSHGPLLRQLKETACIKDIFQARNYNKSFPLCYRRLERMLARLRMNNESVILSEEMFSVHYIALNAGTTNKTRQIIDTWDWKALRKLLESTGWNPIILIGYRRLHEIIPSAHAQWEKWDKHIVHRDAWPVQQKGGRPPKSLVHVLATDPRLGDDYLPSTNFDDKIMLWSYTDTLLKYIAPHIPVRVFTIHDHGKNNQQGEGDSSSSLATRFFCQVLPLTPAACRYAKLHDTKRVTTAARNKTKQQNQTDAKYNRQESTFYDTLACQAALNQWIDTRRFQRRQVAIKTQEYWEKNKSKTPHQLPLKCPHKQLRDQFLRQSLEKEQKIWGKTLAQQWKIEHERAFELNVAAYKYCDVDVDVTLQSKEWKLFFEQFSTVS